MIAYLAGKVLYKTDDSVVIDNDGIGYEVHVTEGQRSGMSEGREVILYIYHHLTENSEGLYGFESKEERQFFTLLLSVSGIGPRTALGMMNVSMETLASAILNEDIDALTEVPGIGKKTAERIIIELRNKVSMPSVDARSSVSTKTRPQTLPTSPINNIEAIEALVTLGYSRLEATRMLGQVPIEIVETHEIIRYALKR